MHNDDKETIVIFHRRWWKSDGKGGLEPGASKPVFVKEIRGTWDDARKECRLWNEANPKGKYNDRAEFQDAATFYAQWPQSARMISRSGLSSYQRG
jgi:hypothetical protein